MIMMIMIMIMMMMMVMMVMMMVMMVMMMVMMMMIVMCGRSPGLDAGGRHLLPLPLSLPSTLPALLRCPILPLLRQTDRHPTPPRPPTPPRVGEVSQRRRRRRRRRLAGSPLPPPCAIARTHPLRLLGLQLVLRVPPPPCCLLLLLLLLLLPPPPLLLLRPLPLRLLPPIHAPCPQCLRHGDPMHAQARLVSPPLGRLPLLGLPLPPLLIQPLLLQLPLLPRRDKNRNKSVEM
jgi:hypothetical protein